MGFQAWDFFTITFRDSDISKVFETAVSEGWVLKDDDWSALDDLFGDAQSLEDDSRTYCVRFEQHEVQQTDIDEWGRGLAKAGLVFDGFAQMTGDLGHEWLFCGIDGTYHSVPALEFAPVVMLLPDGELSRAGHERALAYQRASKQVEEYLAKEE